MFCYERGVRSENAHMSVWKAIKTIHFGVNLENSLCTSHGDRWTRMSISIQHSSIFTVRMSNWDTSVLFFLLLTVSISNWDVQGMRWQANLLVRLHFCVLLKCFGRFWHVIPISYRSLWAEIAFEKKKHFQKRMYLALTAEWQPYNHNILHVTIWTVIIVACHLCLFKWLNKVLPLFDIKQCLPQKDTDLKRCQIWTQPLTWSQTECTYCLVVFLCCKAWPQLVMVEVWRGQPVECTHFPANGEFMSESL